jgi:5'-nucleotidase
MRKVLLVAAVVVMTVLPGCKKKSQQDMVDVPPPPPMPDSSSATVAPMEMAPAATGAGSTYTVQKGDTLWSIAQRIYGDGKKWQSIAQANGNLDPRQLKVGQTLTLP